jgi:hypothetical protein
MSTSRIEHKSLVYFKLQGDFDPDLVSSCIDLEPTAVMRKGERDPVRGLPKISMWEYSAGEVEGDIINVYDITSVLIADLSPYVRQISEIRARLGIEAVLQVVLWISADQLISNPAVGFEVDVVRFLADVGASIDIDTYRRTE